MTEIEKKFIACLIKQKVTSFKMSLCQHSEACITLIHAFFRYSSVFVWLKSFAVTHCAEDVV